MKYCYDYPRTAVTVDAVIFRKTDHSWEILLIRRGKAPFLGQWALPGGFLEMEETLEEAVARELMEETGLSGLSLEQFHAFSALDRDPRHRTISIAFRGILAEGNPSAKAGDDAQSLEWFDASYLPELAFDHEEVIRLAIDSLEKCPARF
jgi:8-oxo-dGTP diphosphatase